MTEAKDKISEKLNKKKEDTQEWGQGLIDMSSDLFHADFEALKNGTAYEQDDKLDAADASMNNNSKTKKNK